MSIGTTIAKPMAAGVLFSIILFTFFGPISTVIIEPEKQITLGDMWGHFTFTDFSYTEVAIPLLPQIYTATFNQNGEDYSFSFEFDQLPMHVTIAGADFTVIHHTTVMGYNPLMGCDTERHILDVARGHKEIKRMSLVGAFVEMWKEGN